MRGDLMRVGEASLKRMLQLCEQRNLSINKLATLSGITQSTLNNWVNRGIENPTLPTIKKICDGLGISIIDFFDCDFFKDLEPETE